MAAGISSGGKQACPDASHEEGSKVRLTTEGRDRHV